MRVMARRPVTVAEEPNAVSGRVGGARTDARGSTERVRRAPVASGRSSRDPREEAGCARGEIGLEAWSPGAWVGAETGDRGE